MYCQIVGYKKCSCIFLICLIVNFIFYINKDIKCFQASLEKEGVGVELLKKSVEALGGLDLLVNNAGVTRFENILANRLGNIYLYSSHAFISSSSIGVVQNAVMKADARRELVTRGIFRSIAALRIL